MRRPDPSRLSDETAERVRASHHEAIGEIQSAIIRLEAHPANYLGRQILTGSGTYVPARGTTRAIVRLVGGGGGGGGAGGGAGVAAGAGGSSGVYVEAAIEATGAMRGGTYSCGAGGAAGSTAGGNGGTGGDTTIAINGVTYTAKGGGGGQGMASSAGGFALPIAPAAGSSSGSNIFSTYDIGDPGINIGGTYWFSGSGGTSPLGHGTIGGNDGAGTGAGVDGGPGGGGSGASEQLAGGLAGGAGGAGTIVIDQWGP